MRAPKVKRQRDRALASGLTGRQHAAIELMVMIYARGDWDPAPAADMALVAADCVWDVLERDAQEGKT